MTTRRDDSPVRPANQVIFVIALGWLGAAGLAIVATLRGEGQEWAFEVD